MKAVDILNYIDQIKKESEGYTSNIYFNDSILHASIIMDALFDKALQENDKTLNMYCGSFSLFRDDTGNTIENIIMKCTTEGINDTNRDKWNKLDPFGDLQKKLTLFLSDEKKGNLNIVIERGLESLKENKVWKTLKSGINNGRVNLSVLSNPIGIGHFAVTEEAYRLENNDCDKTAIGCFMDYDNAFILNDNFNFLQKISEPICI